MQYKKKMYTSLNLIIISQVLVLSCVLSKETVLLVEPHSTPKFFQVPTANEPVIAWMDIQKGIYPNTSHINTALTIGEPITIFIYFKDNSFTYDIQVTDCWAYDGQNFEKSKNRLHLMEEHLNKKMRIIEKWSKKTFSKGQPLKTLLYTDLISFKFPDSEQIYMKCDIELCYKECGGNSK